MEAIIGKQYPNKVIPLIEASKSSIKIIVFDWRWYPNDPGNPVQLFNQALIRAQRRGVEIKAITNIKEIVNILKQNGCQAKTIQTQKLVHPKLILIDDEVMVLGSHNFTQSAFTMNFEASVILQGRTELDEFLRFFDNMYNNYGELS